MKPNFLALALLILPFSSVLSKWAISSERKINECGRDIHEYRNYISKLYNVSLERVANLILGDHLYISKYKSLLEGTCTPIFCPKLSQSDFAYLREFRNVMTTDAIRYNNLSSAYIRLADAFHDAKLEEWKDLKTSWISRTVYYTRKLYDTPFVDVANVTENQTALYTDDFIIIDKHVKNRNDFVNGIIVKVDYCAVAQGSSSTYMEVDVNLIIESSLLSFFQGSIEESSHKGFLEFYGLLDYLLNYFADHPEEPISLKLKPLSKNDPNIIHNTARVRPLSHNFSGFKTIFAGNTTLFSISSSPSLPVSTTTSLKPYVKFAITVATLAVACIIIYFIGAWLRDKFCPADIEAVSTTDLEDKSIPLIITTSSSAGAADLEERNKTTSLMTTTLEE